MKILQIINSLEPGGAEKLVVESTILYRKKGLQVDVLILNDNNTPLYDELTGYPDIKIHALKNTSVYNPLNIFKIKSIIKDYDIIHAHLFPVSYWIAFTNMFSLKKKSIVFTEHNTTNRRRSIFIFKLIDRLIYKQFTKVVTISESVDESLKQHLDSKNNSDIIKIHNGIHLDVFKTAQPYAKKELDFDEQDKLIIQVSSFTPQKDQKTLIKALTRLPVQIKLILVGIGPLIEECKDYTKELKLEDRVCFLGVRNDVPRLLKTVDVVVLSSHYEGLSLSCIEGMISGNPFVASNTPGLGNVVKDSGLVFEDGNYEQLASKISKLLDDKDYSFKIAKKCMKKAQLFDINLMSESYVELYTKMMSTK